MNLRQHWECEHCNAKRECDCPEATPMQELLGEYARVCRMQGYSMANAERGLSLSGDWHTSKRAQLDDLERKMLALVTPK